VRWRTCLFKIYPASSRPDRASNAMGLTAGEGRLDDNAKITSAPMNRRSDMTEGPLANPRPRSLYPTWFAVPLYLWALTAGLEDRLPPIRDATTGSKMVCRGQGLLSRDIWTGQTLDRATPCGAFKGAEDRRVVVGTRSAPARRKAASPARGPIRPTSRASAASSNARFSTCATTETARSTPVSNCRSVVIGQYSL